jgi:2-methylisocitrate lyase-like PEP mutase family enzyme
MSAQKQKAETFRELHLAPGAFVIPNPWDPGTAKMLHKMGFKALATTSAGYAFSQGRVDGTTGRDEMLAHCREIVAATPLPVSADLENGFFDSPEEVAATITAAAEAGLAGASIEDATGRPEDPIYDFTLAVERVVAAVEAARALDFPFTFTARAENFLFGRADLEDTIQRLSAFEAAGADVLYAPGLKDLDSIGQVCRAVGTPVNVVMGLAGLEATLDELAAVGVKRISLGSTYARLAYGAFLAAARQTVETGRFDLCQDAPGFKALAPYLDGK